MTGKPSILDRIISMRKAGIANACSDTAGLTAVLKTKQVSADRLRQACQDYRPTETETTAGIIASRADARSRLQPALTLLSEQCTKLERDLAVARQAVASAQHRYTTTCRISAESRAELLREREKKLLQYPVQVQLFMQEQEKA